MLKLAGKYADICYVPLRGVSEEQIKQSKEHVLKTAEKANRTSRIAIAAGSTHIEQVKYEPKEYFSNVESAVKSGATYYLTPFPATEDFMESMRKFAREIMPSFK